MYGPSPGPLRLGICPFSSGYVWHPFWWYGVCALAQFCKEKYQNDINENRHELLILLEYSNKGAQLSFFLEVFKTHFVNHISDKAI